MFSLISMLNMAVYYKARVVIPQPFHTQLLTKLHDGHLGLSELNESRRTQFYLVAWIGQ